MARLRARSSTIARTTSRSTSGPIPAACERMSAVCSSAERSAGMTVLASAPNPVETPYTGSTWSTSRSTTAAPRSIAARASSPSATGRAVPGDVDDIVGRHPVRPEHERLVGHACERSGRAAPSGDVLDAAAEAPGGAGVPSPWFTTEPRGQATSLATCAGGSNAARAARTRPRARWRATSGSPRSARTAVAAVATPRRRATRLASPTCSSTPIDAAIGDGVAECRGPVGERRRARRRDVGDADAVACERAMPAGGGGERRAVLLGELHREERMWAHDDDGTPRPVHW